MSEDHRNRLYNEERLMNDNTNHLDIPATNFDREAVYTHMSISVRAGEPNWTMDNFFVGGVAPKVGDEIKMICTVATENRIEINLLVIPKA